MRGKDQLRMALDQTKLRTDAPVPSIEQLAYVPPDPEKVMSFLNKLQFKSIIKQIETGNFFEYMSIAERNNRPPGLLPPSAKPKSPSRSKKVEATQETNTTTTSTSTTTTSQETRADAPAKPRGRRKKTAQDA